MPKVPLFSVVLIILIVYSVLIYSQRSPENEYKPGNWTQADTAVNQAKHFFAIRKASGEDLSAGPCISNALMSGWVADIVHSPRIPEDDLAQNKCSALLEGKADHLVELDLEGNVVTVK